MTDDELATVIKEYLAGRLTTAAAASAIFEAKGGFMFGNARPEDMPKLRELTQHVGWLALKKADPAGAPAEPPRYDKSMWQIPPEVVAHLKKRGLPPYGAT